MGFNLIVIACIEVGIVVVVVVHSSSVVALFDWAIAGHCIVVHWLTRVLLVVVVRVGIIVVLATI